MRKGAPGCGRKGPLTTRGMKEAADRSGLGCPRCQVLFEQPADATRGGNLAPCILDDDADRLAGRVHLSSFGNRDLQGHVARRIRTGFAVFEFRNPAAAIARAHDVFFAAQKIFPNFSIN